MRITVRSIQIHPGLTACMGLDKVDVWMRHGYFIDIHYYWSGIKNLRLTLPNRREK